MIHRSLLVTAWAVVLGSAGHARAQLITALTSTNTLVTFNANTPSTIISTVPVTGISAVQSLRSIDCRPIDG